MKKITLKQLENARFINPSIGWVDSFGNKIEAHDGGMTCYAYDIEEGGTLEYMYGYGFVIQGNSEINKDEFIVKLKDYVLKEIEDEEEKETSKELHTKEARQRLIDYAKNEKSWDKIVGGNADINYSYEIDEKGHLVFHGGKYYQPDMVMCKEIIDTCKSLDEKIRIIENLFKTDDWYKVENL